MHDFAALSYLNHQQHRPPLLQFSTLLILALPALAQPMLQVMVGRHAAAVLEWRGSGCDVIMQKYRIICILGDGAFGTVFKAVNNRTSEVVAIKKMKSKYRNWEECLELREIKSLRKLSHPNIIKLKEVLLVSEELHLVFEYLDTNLYEEYSSRKRMGNPFSEKQIKNMLFQLASALAHMHKNGFFHRDLKPENLLLAGGVLKICDFGLAREIRSRPPFTDYVSTRWYRAPELLLRSTNYNSPVDVFAFACIAAELYNLSPLFPGSNDLDQLGRVVKVLGTPEVGDWPQGYKLAKTMGYSFPAQDGVDLMELAPTLSFDALDLLRNTLRYSSRKRLTMTEILKHSFFEGVTLQCVTEREKEIVFEAAQEGKVLDSSKHEKDLQEFRMTKAKFRQTRRHNAIESDPFKLLEKHHQHHPKKEETKKEDPAEDIDDIIKELEEKRSREKSSKELGLKPKIREKFYTEAQPKDYEDKDIYNKYVSVKTEKNSKEEEHKKYASNNSHEVAFKREGKNIFAYGFQPSFPSLLPNSIDRSHFGTPVLNPRTRAVNISLNAPKDPPAKQKIVFPAILPFRY